MDDGEVPQQQFLDGVGRLLGTSQQGRYLIRVVQQGDGTEGDHVRCGLVPGEKDERGQVGGVTGADGPAVHLFGQPRHHIVAGFGALACDELVEVLTELLLGLHDVLEAGGEVDEDLGTPLEEVVVLVRDAEQVADHQRGQGQGELFHQVGGRSLPGHLVQQLHGQALDPGPHRVDALDHELPGERLAHMGVHRFVVVLEEAARALRLPLPPAGEGRHPRTGAGVGAEGAAAQDRAGVLVAGDEIGVEPAVVDGDGAEALLGAALKVRRGRVQWCGGGAVDGEAGRVGSVHGLSFGDGTW
ncbi:MULTISPECIES: hypothetical protein [Streptomyces]|uniref:Uncharacterized protein n=2 Tax=Streptomyces TaxID=1883 RepID=A0ABV9J9K1_9ACTN